VEYKAICLEQKLKEYLALENHFLPPAEKSDMSDWSKKVYLCRYLVDSQSPFDLVIYNNLNPPLAISGQNILRI